MRSPRLKSMARLVSSLISARRRRSTQSISTVNTRWSDYAGDHHFGRCLFERAAKLPRVEIKRPQKVIGSATVEAMQSGLYHGYVGLVDGILKKMIDELGRSRR